MIQATFDLEFALQAGMTITPKDITYPEFLRLRLLAQERNRFEAEAIDRSRGR